MGIAHYTCTATALVVCIVMLSFYKVESTSIFQLDILSYNNPEGRDIFGGCCSGRRRADESCQGNCSVYLRFCIKHYEVNVDLKGECTFIEYLTPLLSSSSHAMDSQDQSKLSFDLNFTWLGEFSLIVEAWQPSQGKGNNKVLISRFIAQRALEIGLEWTSDKLESDYSSLELKYRVICADGYYGPKCKTLCRPRDDNFGHYKCGKDGTMICMQGWEGSYCNSAVCAAGCHNGTCLKPGECNCRFGWEGPLCDQCKTYPGCVHGGCRKPWTCICDEGWGGVLCDKDLNYCTNHKPCENGGTCTNTGQGSYTCTCSDDYMGDNCDKLKNPCMDSPCLNNGICNSPSIGKYDCTCKRGYFGPHCETSASICTEGLCKNGGSCISNPDGFLCSCPAGFTGALCEKVQTCDSSHCLKGGTCMTSSDGIHCICPHGISGDRCEHDNRCTNLCKNGGICVVISGNASCTCPYGYSGAFCHIKQTVCSANICANGGTCRFLDEAYYCECKPGFTGKNCTQPQNTCSSSPCLNGATCHVTENGFSCHCLHGFKGNRCHLSLDGIPNDWNEGPSVASNVSHRISEKEKETSSASQLYLIIGLSATFTVLIILIVCIVVRYRIRLRRPQKPVDEHHKDCDFDLVNEQNERNAMYMNNKNCDMPQKIVNELDRIPVIMPHEAPPKVLNSEISNKRIPDMMSTSRTLLQKIDNISGNSTNCHSPQGHSPCSNKPIYTIEDHLRPCPDKGVFLNMGENLGTDV
ncbi:delta-like protein B [Parasteatoda tepidariorum]|uniref:delta-like protein B n=1 Tax=Parasteatoda tepidariorum TaxID=114398 RepID=UPI00077FAA28|nr:neurogenic locus protein delta [Parasteatoda tepidariorum]XP_015905654.1 neurogenic locus protein delta [Parasteatoda tepidariorum]XP_042896750.1 neurogenic locus protein delta [Parasteatoda tepidariorum]XP_042896751.1 neurogenic locus protein delta [Parasteatoda tepidariorum]